MDVRTEEFTWKEKDGTDIYAVAWPADEPVAVMGIIHGIGEHSRRYDHLAAWFVARGITCIGYDRRGHGRSGGIRGHASAYNLLLDEVDSLLAACSRRCPTLPNYLYGHSMGGQVLLNYLIQRQPGLAGAIVSAPHIDLPTAPGSFQVALGKLMRRFKPDFTQPSPVDATLLSRDPEVVRRYRQDKLVHDHVSAQLGIDLLEAAATLNAYGDGLPVATLLIHGDGDGITDHGASRRFADRNRNGVAFKSFPGYYHELHNEPTWPEVAEVVLAWMQSLTDRTP